jgi:hypothetical protein
MTAANSFPKKISTTENTKNAERNPDARLIAKNNYRKPSLSGSLAPVFAFWEFTIPNSLFTILKGERVPTSPFGNDFCHPV